MKRMALMLAVVTVAACAVNPVTGERNLQFYGSDWEKDVGAQMYAPMKQSQGGEFILDPVLTEYIQGVGQRLANNARRGDELEFEFSIINSSIPNAWALPGGKIVINRGLLVELDSEAELAAVLGHEIVHADAAHGARAQSKGVLTQVGTVAGMIVVGTTVDSSAGRELGMMVPQLGAQMLTQKYGRDAEREADEYGMRYMAEAGYDPEGAVELQQTFVRLSEGRRQDWLSGLFASHPPSEERVENNRETALQLAEEGYTRGETGAETWAEKTAYLRRVQPAYEHYDKASEAASEKDWSSAQKHLDAAFAIEPRESLFHALQGDIYAARDQYGDALKSYEEAVAANRGLFYGYLRRGRAHLELSENQLARKDLEHSLTLLPTAQAHYLLGKLDMAEDRRVAAMKHFRQAAQSGTETGLKAEREILALDLPQRASSYVAAQVVSNAQGELWIQVGNQTRSNLHGIEYRYAWIDNSGQTRQGSGRIDGVLEGGQWAQAKLDGRINDPANVSRRAQAEIVSAELAD
ncbi:MAG: M48 family metalloprotease [Xanthomonadales bacterium]|nr:M48 family metalloprotease [Xanthomonadales bacterium]